MKALITGKPQGLALELVKQLDERGYDTELLDPETIDDGLVFTEHYDVIINCWGINHLAWIGDTDYKDSKILTENVFKPYWLINQLVKFGNRPAKVINVSSQTWRVAQRCTTLYCASKAALVQMTKVMARELAPYGWQVNAYCPGKILDTEMSKLTDKQVEELRGWSKVEADGYAMKNIPIGRFMDVQEAAFNCLKILEFTSYVNGTTIEAMGGV